MRYVSTRGNAPPAKFDELLFAGLAPDGGLYVPEAWPSLDIDEIRALVGLPYLQVVNRIVTPYLKGSIEPRILEGIIENAYAGFEHTAVAPLRQLSSHEWMLELFHGPTLAFKDFALQLLGKLFDHSRSLKGEHITIVAATSGDTGSAAIDACRGLDRVKTFVLHPKGRVSEVQRRQMTTVVHRNIHNIAVEGTFDDCQAAVKAMFNDPEFRDSYGLTAVNSINWARVMSQIAYYFYSAASLGAPDREIAFVVPTGNFGDVYAGYVADIDSRAPKRGDRFHNGNLQVDGSGDGRVPIRVGLWWIGSRGAADTVANGVPAGSFSRDGVRRWISRFFAGGHHSDHHLRCYPDDLCVCKV